MSAPIGYFDYAAATPLDKNVIASMLPVMNGQFFNPSSSHKLGRAAKAELDLQRKKAAELLGVKPINIVFTAGASEANNLAISGVMQAHPNGNVIVSAVEHESVMAVSQKYDVRVAPVDERGLVILEELEKLIDEQTALVSVMYANNEVGTIQPLRRISQMLEVVRATRKDHKNTQPIYLHTDATQAVNYLDVHAHRLGVDLMTIGGGKIYGPKQTGLLCVLGGISLTPQVYGGGQEWGYRSGTENLAQITGLVQAMAQSQALRNTEVDRLRILQHQTIKRIRVLSPEIIVNGHLKHRLPNNIHVTLPGYDNERLIMQLEEMGVYVAAGSACAASSDRPSHVLRAMGLSDEAAQSSLRITMGRGTDENSVELLCSSIAELLVKN